MNLELQRLAHQATDPRLTEAERDQAAHRLAARIAACPDIVVMSREEHAQLMPVPTATARLRSVRVSLLAIGRALGEGPDYPMQAEVEAARKELQETIHRMDGWRAT